MIDDKKFDEILNSSGISATPTEGGWYAQLQNETPQEPSMLEKTGNTIMSIPGAETVKNLGIGVLKGVGELGKEGEAMLNAPLKALGLSTPKPVYSEMNLEPEGAAQTIGKVGEKIAEYAIPEKWVASGFARLAPTTLKLLQTAKDFGISMIQTEGDVGASTGSTIVSGLLRGLPADIPVVKKFLVQKMADFSGYPSKMLETALQRGGGVKQGITKGEPVLADAVLKTVRGVQDYANKTVQESKVLVNKLGKETAKVDLRGPLGEAIDDYGDDFVSKLSSSFRDKYNIGFNKNGTLLFNRANKPSNIVSKAEQDTIQEVYNMAKSISDNINVGNIDAKMERMITYLTKTSAGTPTGPETKKIVSGIIKDVVDHVKKVGDLIPEYPEFKQYADYLEGSATTRGLINDMKEIFGDTSHPSASDLSKITTRVLQVFNQGKLALKEGVGDVVGLEGILKKIGSDTDLIGKSAGVIMKSGEEVSARALQLTKRELFNKVVEYIPRKTIQAYVKSGNLVDLSKNPIIKKIAETLRISAIQVVNNIAKVIND
jgi:hypothetical protein